MGSAASTMSEADLRQEIRAFSTSAPDKFETVLKHMLACKAEIQMQAVFNPAAGAKLGTSKGDAAAADAAAKGDTFTCVGEEPVSISVQIAQEISVLRANPAEYALHLQKHLDNFVTDKEYIIDDPAYRYEAAEGRAAVEEAIAELRNTAPLAALLPNSLLEKAAADHVKDMASHAGLSGHTGSDGSESHERIARYGTYEVTCGENIDYGMQSARSIIVHLLVDDGVPSRGHRKNLLEARFALVGASFGFHSEYRCCCVMDFAGGMKDFQDMITVDMCVECPAGQQLPETVFKIINSFSSGDNAKQIVVGTCPRVCVCVCICASVIMKCDWCCIACEVCSGFPHSPSSPFPATTYRPRVWNV